MRNGEIPRGARHSPPWRPILHSAFCILGWLASGSERVVGAGFIRAHSRDSRAASGLFSGLFSGLSRSLRSFAAKPSAEAFLLCGFEAEEELSADGQCGAHGDRAVSGSIAGIGDRGASSGRESSATCALGDVGPRIRSKVGR